MTFTFLLLFVYNKKESALQSWLHYDKMVSCEDVKYWNLLERSTECERNTCKNTDLKGYMLYMESCILMWTFNSFNLLSNEIRAKMSKHRFLVRHKKLLCLLICKISLIFINVSQISTVIQILTLWIFPKISAPSTQYKISV